MCCKVDQYCILRPFTTYPPTYPRGQIHKVRDIASICIGYAAQLYSTDEP